MAEPKIFIVGAGPTGLVLATWLAKTGIPFRIVEKNDGPGQASRAMAVQARSLEFYRQLGFADEVVSRGIRVARIHFRKGERKIVNFNFENFGTGLSPFPFVLSFPQDEHEKFLADQLAGMGVPVEWSTELTGFTQNEKGVRAQIKGPRGPETLDVEYICGCDGARSTVRQTLNVGFPGGTYERLFYVADVHLLTGPMNQDLNGCLGPDFLLIVFPIRTSGQHRLIGVVPDLPKKPEDITFDDVRSTAEYMADVRVDKVNWFSTYKVHHRVAEHFRVGRAFICGDAGHIHSPAGGQGMNTGIGDAVNLAWKLAAVVSGRASAEILDSYEPERLTFARSLVATTDRAFTGIAGRGLLSKFVRGFLLPYVFPALVQLPSTRKDLFRLASQVAIQYRDSPLSRGDADALRGGDRLPWVPLAGGAGNFDALKSLDWQLHIYGEATLEIRDLTSRLRLPLREFPWSNEAHEAGLERNGTYLVRPDGYIGRADREPNPAQLEHYFQKFAIVMS
jgi:2-polyprenyl-6-methoxyphenol hydroxylase-like FAD-dependent oxidoreductase